MNEYLTRNCQKVYVNIKKLRMLIKVNKKYEIFFQKKNEIWNIINLGKKIENMWNRVRLVTLIKVELNNKIWNKLFLQKWTSILNLNQSRV